MNTESIDDFDADLPPSLRDAMRRLARPELPPGLRYRMLNAVFTESTDSQPTPVRRIFFSDDTKGNTRQRYWREEVKPVPHTPNTQPAPVREKREPGPRLVRRVVSVSIFGPNK